MTADFFAVFDLPHSFDIDLADLQKRYFTAQRTFHPDRLVGKSAEERQQAISQSMLVNEAYEVLKAPLSRAQHLLVLRGVATDSVKPSQDLLMEIMELRENLAEANTASELAKIATQNEAAIQSASASLSHAFLQGDTVRAAELTMRLSYLTKLTHEIQIRRKRMDAA